MKQTTVLLDRWYEGDRNALNDLLQLHYNTICTMVRRRRSKFLKGKEDTGDVVQEALMKFLKRGPQVRFDSESSFLRFMAVVVENSLRDRFDFYTAKRRAGNNPVTLSTNVARHSETPSLTCSKDEKRDLLRLGLELIRPKQRALIFLRDWEKMPFPDVAETLSLSEDNAKQSYYRAKSALTKALLRLRTGGIDDLLSECEQR